MKSIFWYSFIAITLLSSCKQDPYGNGGEANSSVAIKSLSVDSDVVEVKSSAVDASQLKIRLENTRGEVLRTWENIASMPARVNMVAGSYKFVAWSGDTSALPSFNHNYYYGQVKFAIGAGQTLDTVITAKLGVVKVKVVFDASFASEYSTYSADVRTTTPEKPDTRFLNFTPLDVETANFEPGTFRMRLRLTSVLDGKEYIFMPSPIPNFKAQELRTVKLAVKKINGRATLQVTTDYGYDKEEIIELKLPSSIMPKPRPALRAVGFELSSSVLSNESLAAIEKRAAVIIAQGGVKSVVVRTTNPNIIQMWGGNTQLEIVDATVEQSNWLKKAGFAWGDEIATSQRANRNFGRAEISLNGLYSNLTADVGQSSTIYPFEIEVVDMFGQSNKDAGGAGSFLINFEQRPPIFALQRELGLGDIWSHSAALPITYTTNIAGREPYVEVKKAGDNWAKPEQSFAAQADGVGLQRVTGLEAATEYSFRVRMGQHMLAEYTATTEAEQKVENGDMESWQAEQMGTSPHKIPYYWPYANGQSPYWTTNNDRTTSYRATWFTYGYNSAPAVSYSLSAYNGTFAAEIRTTSASNIDALNTTSVSQKHSQVAGRLYIGDFKYDKPNDIKTFGKPFASRPLSFKFYYTYNQYNNDSFDAEAIAYSGDVEIGRGYFASAVGVSSSDYIECVVPIIYSVIDKRADRFTISFRSTTKSQPEVYKNGSYMLNFVGNEDYNKNWAIWIGSVLRVDDISVNY